MLEIWHLFKNAVILIEMLIAVFAVIFFTYLPENQI